MPRTKTRRTTITAAVRTMRDALAATKRAAEAWRSADEGRDDVANGMGTLLAELNADKDGNHTVDVMAELLDEHVERLSESPPQGHVFTHALATWGRRRRPSIASLAPPAALVLRSPQTRISRTPNRCCPQQ